MADNQALGELAAQDRYDPIVPAPDVLPRSTQVLGGLAVLGGGAVDPVVLPQNPNPLADNPFSHYVAQKLFGLGQNAVSALSVPGDVWNGNLDPTSDEGMDRAIGLAQMITEAPRGGGAGSGTVLGSGIRAYHGSPYDFDRFDMSKIGTGEGAQAYGHGLYFAENQAVAQAYRRSLEDSVAKLLGNKQTPKGKMYEVNINAHPDEFLDWDKPLGQQSPQMRASLLSAELPKSFNKEAMGRALEGNETAYDRDWNPTTGSSLYRQIAKTSSLEDAGAALHLRDAGIPGIKYLDQGSRGSGTGTSNYVVFNDKLIDILRKYGLAGLTAGTGATAAGQQMDNSAPFGMIGAVAGGAMGSLARQDQYQQ